MAYERTISEVLWELGVTHARDARSPDDGKHSLFYAGRSIGRYSAFDVATLLQEEREIEAREECAIRADERERCAAEIERRNWPCVEDARRIAANIRTLDGGAGA